MVSVNIAKLKAELSKYVKLAESGEEVVVTDHRKPVARLVSVVSEEKFRERVKIIPATRHISELDTLIFPEPIPDLDVVALLREDRDAR